MGFVHSIPPAPLSERGVFVQPLFKNYGFKNGVAVVARIKSIRTTHVQGEDGERQEVKIGDGELIDIAYMGDVFL
jgi:hypothetical protein